MKKEERKSEGRMKKQEKELRREAKCNHHFTVSKYRVIQNRSGFFKKFIAI